MIKRAKIIVLILAIVGGIVFFYQIVSGKARLNIEFSSIPEVTAHRGASEDYPENTMAAFNGAKEQNADWIEIDIQYTKDKQIVVFHDESLSRVASLKKNINELYYDDISKLDAGSFKNSKFKDERIPLFSDVLKFAKDNNIRLNIELKLDENNDQFEKNVIELIKSYNFENKCVVASKTYESLENIKKIDKRITTAYILSELPENIAEYDKADVFSIKEEVITEEIVKDIHNLGKEVFVWTVNSEDRINKMIELSVDNIITDDVELVKKLLKPDKDVERTNWLLSSLQK